MSVDQKAKKVVVIIECGISADKDFKKLYLEFGDSLVIINHNNVDSSWQQIKEMTNISSKYDLKNNVICCVLGDNYYHIMDDIYELTNNIGCTIWYMPEKNLELAIKILNKNLLKGKLFIFDDAMRLVKCYVV